MICVVWIPVRFNLTLQGARYILATMSALVMSAIPHGGEQKCWSPQHRSFESWHPRRKS